jgi:serine/threonine protein kinase
MRTEAQHIGSYELRQCLRRDNTSDTWRAYDTSTQRMVILKFYRTDLLDTADSLTPYLHNVEQVAALHHPNIARIQDIQVLAPRSAGDSSSLICLAVECVEGETLADYIKNTSAVGKMPPATEVVHLFSSLALAIDGAHQRGIIHGNLKPANILLNQAAAAPVKIGTPMITDFGATRLLPKRQGNDLPFYLAPEQIKGTPADERSDVYALGVLLYELYTGMPPFRGSRPIAVMMQHINAQPTSPDLVNPSISPALTRVILRCLAKNPQERFPNAASLAIALANALRVEIPESLRRFAALTNRTTLAVSPQETPSTPLPETRAARMRDIPPAHPGARLPGAPSGSRGSSNRSLVIVGLLGLLLILGASSGAFLLMQRNAASQAAGHAFFLNSGQLNASNAQGINDELQIELSHVPDPATGKSYYAWLLGDISKTESTPLLIGRLTVEQGTIHFLYPGDNQHANLLGVVSRFLITEDDAHNPSSNPLLDQSIWRYYAVLPQTPDKADPLHFSMLDHLRHLLVESPELAARGLHGGLAFWFARDSATVADLASGLARDWQRKDANTLHDQIVRILDYLDGASFIQADVPSGTPLLADAQISQVGLLGPAPRSPDPPGYVYQNEAPPGYVYLLQQHLNGAILSPQATANQHQLAIQISKGIDTVRRFLTQAYQDAKQLVQLNNAQFLQASTLTTLDDLATQTQYAYTGQPDPATGTSQSGALWLYTNLQRLATFDVAPYSASKS